MIQLNNPRWRAVRLENEESVAYLNRLFRRGWYMLLLDVDGISYLTFKVPLKPPRYIEPKDVHQSLELQNEKAMTVVILRKGTRRGLQRAEIAERASTHYALATTATGVGRDGWKAIIVLTLEEGGVVTIFERMPPGAGHAADEPRI